jgi:hypothetical protein
MRSRAGYYILGDDGEPVAVDLNTWAEWYETHFADRVVAKTETDNELVSTVFLSLDHAFLEPGPILFETMIFGGEYDQWQWRHQNRHQALAFHEQLVAALRAGMPPPDLSLDMRGPRSIRTVAAFHNGMVGVWDENGEQVQELQGRFVLVKDAVLAAADDKTKYAFVDMPRGRYDVVSREEWSTGYQESPDHDGMTRGLPDPGTSGSDLHPC